MIAYAIVNNVNYPSYSKIAQELVLKQAYDGVNSDINASSAINYVIEAESFAVTLIREQLTQALEFHDRECYEREIEIYQQILALLPLERVNLQSLCAGIYTDMAIAKLYQGKYEESRLLQRKGDSLDSNPKRAYDYGNALGHAVYADTTEQLKVSSGELQDIAHKFLKKALKAEPYNPAYVMSYVGMLANLERDQEALAILPLAIPEGARDAEYYNMQAHFYLNRK